GVEPGSAGGDRWAPPDVTTRAERPDGGATAGETLVTITHYLGINPKWVDGTAVGSPRDGPLGPAARGSFMIHVRHAAAAIASGLCETVLITHGESGRSGVGAPAMP